MIIGIDWLEEELEKKKKQLKLLEDMEQLNKALAPIVLEVYKDEITKEGIDKTTDSIAQQKYSIKMYIAMLEYSINNHMEYKD